MWLSNVIVNDKYKNFKISSGSLHFNETETGWNGPVHNENAHLTVSDYYQRRVSTMCPPQCVSGSSW